MSYCVVLACLVHILKVLPHTLYSEPRSICPRKPGIYYNRYVRYNTTASITIVTATSTTTAAATTYMTHPPIENTFNTLPTALTPLPKAFPPIHPPIHPTPHACQHFIKCCTFQFCSCWSTTGGRDWGVPLESTKSNLIRFSALSAGLRSDPPLSASRRSTEH